MLHENEVNESATEVAGEAKEETKSDRRRFLAQAGLMGLGALGASQLPAAAQDNAFRRAIEEGFRRSGGGTFSSGSSNTNSNNTSSNNSSSNNTNSTTTFSTGGRVTDADIFNFALNLEYLEAEFYVRAAFGRGLSDSDTTGRGTRGEVSGGRAVQFATDTIRQYAEEIARDEETHVRFFRSALGDARVARPALNLDSSFTAAARAAGIISSSDTFDAYASENNFLIAAFIFEDVGVTAFKGAAPLIQNKNNLESAAGILAVEAYHAGIIRSTLFSRGITDPPQRISDLRDSADGPTDLDQGIVLEGRANIVPTDSNGRAFSRTPQQVRNIVYLNGNGTPGGFFPNGLNSRFR